jgi:hypothetical protein
MVRHGAGLLALLLLALVGCGHKGGQVPPDGGNVPPDGGNVPPDGGNVPPDGGNVPLDGGGGHSPIPILRPTIGIDLAQVSSFAVVSGASSAGPTRRGGLAPTDGEQDGGVPSGPQLLALTVSGDVLGVELVENGNPESTGVVSQPWVRAIYPTFTWIIFSTPDLTVFKIHGDGSTESIDCWTIAANRLTGDLYCAPLQIRALANGDPLFVGFQANAAGDVVYAFAVDDLESPIVYKLMLGGDGGPTATLIDPAVHPGWLRANATGDLLVNYYPSLLDHTTMRSKIFPLDGSGAVTVQGDHNSYAACGAPGDADEDIFYVLSGGGGGWPFDGTIRIVTKSGGAFVETQQTVTLPNSGQCSFLFRLGDGLHMFCGMALLRVIAGGTVIPNPTALPITGITQVIEVNGVGINPIDGKVVLLANTGDGYYKFVRHDGTYQEDILLEPNIEPARVNYAWSGAIEFLAVRTDTQEKVRGSVPADDTVVTYTAAGVLDPAQVIVFTPIN